MQYCRKLPYVTGGSRLTPEEELEALRYLPSLVQSSPSLYNRQTILQAVIDRKKTGTGKAPDMPVVAAGLHVPAIPHLDDFDAVVDRTAVDGATAADAITNILGSVTVFKRPEEPVVGGDALTFYLKSMDRSFKLFNEWHFFYELLTNMCPVAIIPGESTFLWGALFCRYLGSWDFQMRSQLMSILRILVNNPQVAATLPHLKDERKHKLPLGIMMRSQETFQRFFKELQTALQTKQQQGELTWPIPPPPIHIDDYKKPVSSMSMKPLHDITNRWAVGPRVTDIACSRREITDVACLPYLPLIGVTVPAEPTERARLQAALDVTSRAVRSFAGQPIAQHIDLSSVIVYVSREEMRKAVQPGAPGTSSFLLDTVPPTLPFVLGDHAAARTPLGKSTLRRLQTEMKAYSDRTNKERIPQLTFLKSAELPEILASPDKLKAVVARLQHLKADLTRAYIADGRFVDYAIRLVVGITNYPPPPTGQPGHPLFLRQWGFIFGKLSACEPNVTFDLLVSLLLCPTAEDELTRLNPFIGHTARRDILSLAAAVLFVVNRRGQLCRSLHATVNLLTALASVRESRGSLDQTQKQQEEVVDMEDAVVKIRLLTSALTSSLDTRRHYVTLEDDATEGLKAVFDPRYLVFEFAYNILLRRPQIDLIDKFITRVNERASLCHQAIMGAGKTTVVAPLLALLLADGTDLVVQVVPRTLLEFTRTVMQERFSAVIKKGVLTFAFSRYQSITPQMFSALIQAKEKKAVVLATPTSVKSVFLKVLQLFSILDASAEETGAIERVWRTGQTQFAKLRNAMGKVLKIPLLGADTPIDTTQLSGKLTDEEFRVVRRELDLTLRTLNLFKSSVLLLDEVDLLLHPLKSELHWPIGVKRPLDFTRPAPTTQHHQLEEDPELETGLRWKIPWHVLDAIFFAQQTTAPRRLAVPFGNSRCVRHVF